MKHRPDPFLRAINHLRSAQAIIALVLTANIGLTLAALWYARPEFWVWMGTAMALLTFLWLTVDHQIHQTHHRYQVWKTETARDESTEQLPLPPRAFPPGGNKVVPYIPIQSRADTWEDLGQYMSGYRTDGGYRGDIIDSRENPDENRFGQDGKGGNHG